jgi:hypothetical protein
VQYERKRHILAKLMIHLLLNCFRKTGLKFQRRAFAGILVVLGLTGCAGSRHYHAVPAEGPPGAPRFLEIQKEVSVATMHFPPGEYSLNAEDDAGYYYSAPRKIMEHTAIGSRPHAGGVYVNKRNPQKMRGYVYWAGARTHLGNLSRVKHEFRE